MVNPSNHAIIDGDDDSLHSILQSANAEEFNIADLVEPSIYFTEDQFINDTMIKKRFLIMSINVQSIRAKFDQLVCLLERLRTKTKAVPI